MDIGFDALLKAVDIVVILAIMGITEGVKRALPERSWRWIPLVPLALGILVGVILTPAGQAWRMAAKAALLYAGAASLGYELLRTTILKTGGKSEAAANLKLPS